MRLLLRADFSLIAHDGEGIGPKLAEGVDEAGLEAAAGNGPPHRRRDIQALRRSQCLDRAFPGRGDGCRVSAARSIVQAVQEGRAVWDCSTRCLAHDADAPTGRSDPKGCDTGDFRSLRRSHCELRPSRTSAGFPRMVLGGGVEPTRDARPALHDPYDPGFLPKRTDTEDGRVLDTALAGRADALVTANFRDFTHHADAVILRGRIHVRRTAHTKSSSCSRRRWPSGCALVVSRLLAFDGAPWPHRRPNNRSMSDRPRVTKVGRP